MSCWALVPVKRRVECKTRLASVLSPQQRLVLVRRVLSHVLATLQSVPRIDHIAVVSPERDQIPESIELLPEQGTDLNSSLSMAMEAARARGATTILILHSDLPYISASDIEALLDGAEKTGMALGPDELFEGTNALCLPANLNLPLQFGACSYPAHLASAQLHDLNPAVVRTPELGFDLDSSVDLEQYNRLSSSALGRNTSNYGVYQ